MDRIALLREAVVALLTPVAGIALTFYLAATHQFFYWQIPFLGGMVLSPLIGAGSTKSFGRILARVGQAIEEEES